MTDLRMKSELAALQRDNVYLKRKVKGLKAQRAKLKRALAEKEPT